MSELEKDIAHEVERVVSTSQQRLRGLFSRPRLTGSPAPADAVLPQAPAPASFGQCAGPGVGCDSCSCGRHVTIVTTDAAPPPSSLQPKVSKPMALTPTTKQATDKAKSFADRLKTVHTKLNDTMEQGVTSLEQIEASTETVNAKIASVVAQKTADLGALNDVLNQLTNGAPDDEPGAAESAQPATSNATA